MLYVAYGSNMNRQQMDHRCPAAEYLGPCTILDEALRERLFADIDHVRGSETAGVLWHLTTACLESLDRYEGAPRMYRRINVKVRLPDGRTVEALSYRMTRKTAIARDGERFTSGYALACAVGAYDAGQPINPLYKARLPRRTANQGPHRTTNRTRNRKG